MCGIAGMVYDVGGCAPVDWEALKAALADLSAAPIERERPDGFDAILSRMESLGPALRELGAFEEVFGDAARADLVRRAARDLSAWETRGQEAVLLGGEAGAEVLEAWNALWVRARDLGWLMERDVLGAQQGVRALVPAAFMGSAKARFEGWKLRAILENIGRLEVRGRDSLGISCLVTFTSPAARKSFEQRHVDALAVRRATPDFVCGAVVADATSLVLTFKTAQEVGALGDNVARLSEHIREDRVLWEALSDQETRSNVFTHTRWASNGIISEPNCHPVNNETWSRRNGVPPTPSTAASWTMCALNGDVDNYQALLARLQHESGETVSPRITTDAKIIPVMVDWHHARCGDLREAFCKAVSEFEGSVAIAMHSTLEPDCIYLALRGSGQSLFVGIMEHGYVFASELYGVVEQTARFVRMDGTSERVPGRPETAGQVLVLDARNIDGVRGIEAWSFDGERLPLGDADVKRAEITTRDINRGDFEHFLLKEISESPISVEKTLRGKFHVSPEGSGPRTASLKLGETVLPASVAERLKDGRIRRIFLIGQGTAAIAGAAVASMMGGALRGAPLSVKAVKASELSGYSIEERMDDALIVAISQSGTTTDTNRTVDMARARGAAAIAIVNRRNSDLVYKVDGVLYTSDGRDIEMSVASTKAFYSQVVAGYLVALHIAQIMQTQAPEQICQDLLELSRLPDKMRRVLRDPGRIRTFAEAHATTRRDWAVVGSGPTRAAADEIRIKLSELCYKSIATDFIEDKKHIDLSSEPLTLVCAAGLPLMALRDAVKEVAIFKSHKSIPIVICSEGFDQFEPYAAGVIYVPRASENASVLLNTLVGHLWGYFCALAIDCGAAQLKPARAMAVQHLSDGVPETAALTQINTVGRRFHSDLSRGLLNSSLSVDTGAQLSTLFGYLKGSQPVQQLSEDFGTDDLMEALVVALSRAIHELARPIDAIKHQAKTITVGISRLEESLEGVIFEHLREADVHLDALAWRDLALLRAITPATRRVAGLTLYEVQGLGTLGEPQDNSRVRATRKLGIARDMVSRADQGHALVGTKEAVVRNRSCYIGQGRKDERPIVILPLQPSGQVDGLALLHLDFHESLAVAEKAAILRDMHPRYEDLKSQVTETDIEWDDRLLERLDVQSLVTLPVDQLAERIIAGAGAVPASV